MKFINFKDINVENSKSWNEKQILTFDIDWASDDVLNYLLDFLDNHKIKCTFFVTHDTSVLKRIRSNPDYELGIHPNFNPLLNRNSNLSADEIITELKSIVPEAVVLRSHSLTTSGSWLGLYKKHNIKYVSNYMMNAVQNITPFYHVNGLIEVPVFYADDGDVYLRDNPNIKRLKEPDNKLSKFDGIRIYNFHPIHIALNTHSFSQYELAKPFQSNMSEIQKLRKPQPGSETKLKELLNGNG